MPRKIYHTLTQEQRHVIVCLCNDGATVSTITRATGLKTWMVERVLREQGLYTARSRKTRAAKAARQELFMQRPLANNNDGVTTVEPHAYVPSAMHMGDCQICGHLQGSPVHSPPPRTRLGRPPQSVGDGQGDGQQYRAMPELDKYDPLLENLKRHHSNKVKCHGPSKPEEPD